MTHANVSKSDTVKSIWDIWMSLETYYLQTTIMIKKDRETGVMFR